MKQKMDLNKAVPFISLVTILIVFAIVIPYICFKNLEKQSIVERLRATD